MAIRIEESIQHILGNADEWEFRIRRFVVGAPAWSFLPLYGLNSVGKLRQKYPKPNGRTTWDDGAACPPLLTE